MEPILIISLVLTCGLVFERIMKHIKSSSCCGSSIEFNQNASVPDLTNIPILKK